MCKFHSANWKPFCSGLDVFMLLGSEMWKLLHKCTVKTHLMDYYLGYFVGNWWVPKNPIDDTSTSAQVMAWCRQATSHYLSQCWPRSILPYGITRPQWVNVPHSLWPSRYWTSLGMMLSQISSRLPWMLGDRLFMAFRTCMPRSRPLWGRPAITWVQSNHHV